MMIGGCISIHCSSYFLLFSQHIGECNSLLSLASTHEFMILLWFLQRKKLLENVQIYIEKDSSNVSGMINGSLSNTHPFSSGIREALNSQRFIQTSFRSRSDKGGLHYQLWLWTWLTLTPLLPHSSLVVSVNDT